MSDQSGPNWREHWYAEMDCYNRREKIRADLERVEAVERRRRALEESQRTGKTIAELLYSPEMLAEIARMRRA